MVYIRVRGAESTLQIVIFIIDYNVAYQCV